MKSIFFKLLFLFIFQYKKRIIQVFIPQSLFSQINVMEAHIFFSAQHGPHIVAPLGVFFFVYGYIYAMVRFRDNIKIFQSIMMKVGVMI